MSMSCFFCNTTSPCYQKKQNTWCLRALCGGARQTLWPSDVAKPAAVKQQTLRNASFEVTAVRDNPLVDVKCEKTSMQGLEQRFGIAVSKRLRTNHDDSCRRLPTLRLSDLSSVAGSPSSTDQSPVQRSTEPLLQRGALTETPDVRGGVREAR
jgi:hypothetical protein